MSSSRALRSLLAVALLATAALASARQPQKKHAAEAAKLREVAADSAIVDALKKQNSRELPLVAVKLLDNRWFVGKESGLVRQTITGPCANRLREFLAASPAHSEAFVLDTQGAVVCAGARTLNYWYGDQPRWERAFQNTVYSDKEGLLSVPIVVDDTVIGVITSRVAR
jgi:hypothetical protein